jgi:ketosteroid isomerase-like protein
LDPLRPRNRATTAAAPAYGTARMTMFLSSASLREKIKATNKTFEDHWVFAITVRNGKVTKIREYIDTQALARASKMDASGLA